VQRYFLTKNISNAKYTEALAKKIRTELEIETKMDGFLSLNESIEQLLNTTDQLRADRKATILNVIVFVIAATGLPISLMSMLLAINDQTIVIRNGPSLLAD
jgi:hypothetical protein